MWRESRHSSLVLARQPSSLSISSGLLLVRLQDSNFPAAAAALASGLSFSSWLLLPLLCCEGQTKPNSALPKRAAAFLLFFLWPNCNTTLCKLMCTKQCPDQKNTTGACCRLAAAAPHLCHNPQLQPPLQKQHHLFLHFQCSIGVHNTDTQTKMFRDHHIKTQIFFQATKFSSPRP